MNSVDLEAQMMTVIVTAANARSLSCVQKLADLAKQFAAEERAAAERALEERTKELEKALRLANNCKAGRLPWDDEDERDYCGKCVACLSWAQSALDETMENVEVLEKELSELRSSAQLAAARAIISTMDEAEAQRDLAERERDAAVVHAAECDARRIRDVAKAEADLDAMKKLWEQERSGADATEAQFESIVAERDQALARLAALRAAGKNALQELSFIVNVMNRKGGLYEKARDDLKAALKAADAPVHPFPRSRDLEDEVLMLRLTLGEVGRILVGGPGEGGPWNDIIEATKVIDLAVKKDGYGGTLLAALWKVLDTAHHVTVRINQVPEDRIQLLAAVTKLRDAEQAVKNLKESRR